MFASWISEILFAFSPFLKVGFCSLSKPISFVFLSDLIANSNSCVVLTILTFLFPVVYSGKIFSSSDLGVSSSAKNSVISLRELEPLARTSDIALSNSSIVS